MKTIHSEEFEKFKAELEEKLNALNQAHDNYEKSYNACDNFHKDVSVPQKYVLDDKQKVEEQKLLEEFKQSIKDLDGAIEDLRKVNLEFLYDNSSAL